MIRQCPSTVLDKVAPSLARKVIISFNRAGDSIIRNRGGAILPNEARSKITENTIITCVLVHHETDSVALS